MRSTRMGYIVEIDPYNKTRAAKKRTALGRYAHESACFQPARGRQAAGRLHGRRRAQRIHLQVCLRRQLGRSRRQ
jgi:hypothetical protein